MDARRVVLAVALVAIGGLSFLTIDGLVRDGLTGRALVSLFVLALFGFGIVGALMHPPEE